MPGDFVRELRNVPATAPALRAVRKRISREVAALDRAAVLRVAHALIAAGIDRFVAYELVLNHKATMDATSCRAIAMSWPLACFERSRTSWGPGSRIRVGSDAGAEAALTALLKRKHLEHLKDGGFELGSGF